MHDITHRCSWAFFVLVTLASTAAFVPVVHAAAVPTLVPLPSGDGFNSSMVFSARGLSSFGTDLYLSVSGVGKRSLIKYSTTEGTVRTLYNQNLSLCTPDGDVGSPGNGLILSTLPQIDAIREDQIVISLGMPAAQAIWIRLNAAAGASVISAVSRIAGADCSYSQAPWVVPDGGQPVFNHMAPPSGIKYRLSTQQLFLSTYRGVVVVANGTLYPFYGNLSDGYADFNASIERPLIRNRVTANTKGCEQLSFLGDSFLVVPESGLQSISLVDFNSGDVTFAVGATLTPWPPPYQCLISAAGCDARNFSLWEAAGTATVNNRILYATAILFPAIYRIDLQTNAITLVGGNIPADVSGVNVVMPVYAAVRSLAISASSSTLYIASNIGLLSLAIPETSAPAVTPPRTAYCNISVNCVHASDVIGLPPSGCQCKCKPHYTGSRCEINLATKTVSLPVVTVVVPVQQIQTVAVATVSTVTILTSIATPSMGTQGSRGVFLLDLQQCQTDLTSSLDFTASPTQLTLGNDDLKFMFGTVAGNAAIIGGVLLANFVGAKIYQYSKHLSADDAQARTRFPSLASFPVLFVLEGTAYAATTLIITSTATVTHRIVGAIILLFEYGFFVTIVIYMKYYFNCRFVPFTEAEAMPPPTFTFAYVQAAARRLLHITGKWHDSTATSFQVKRFGGIFKEYREEVRAFILFEVGLSLASGTLTGLKPLACNTIVIFIVFAFLTYFIGVCALKPCMSRVQNGTLILVAALQTASAVTTAISVFAESSDLATIGNNITLAALFVVAVTGLAGLVERVYRIVRFFAGGGRNRHPVRPSNGTFAGDAAPALEMNLVTREPTPTPSGTGTSSTSNGLSMIITLAEERQQLGPSTAAGPDTHFPNFSFTRMEGEGPRALPPPDAPVQRSRRIDALRRELDDLISGRVDGQRFDALLADAAQHDTSGSGGSGGSGGSSFQRQSSEMPGTSSSHRSSATRQSSSQFGSTNDMQALEAAALRSSMHRRSASNLSFTSVLAAAAAANRSFNVNNPHTPISTSTTTTTSGSTAVRRRGNIEPQML